jgi:hypothetical protein
MPYNRVIADALSALQIKDFSLKKLVLAHVFPVGLAHLLFFSFGLVHQEKHKHEGRKD